REAVHAQVRVEPLDLRAQPFGIERRGGQHEEGAALARAARKVQRVRGTGEGPVVRARRGRAGSLAAQTTATGILPIFARHSAGPLLCTELPPESTATVTGMSFTS